MRARVRARGEEETSIVGERRRYERHECEIWDVCEVINGGDGSIDRGSAKSRVGERSDLGVRFDDTGG